LKEASPPGQTAGIPPSPECTAASESPKSVDSDSARPNIPAIGLEDFMLDRWTVAGYVLRSTGGLSIS
jgi:hypothetical protein